MCTRFVQAIKRTDSTIRTHFCVTERETRVEIIRCLSRCISEASVTLSVLFSFFQVILIWKIQGSRWWSNCKSCKSSGNVSGDDDGKVITSSFSRVVKWIRIRDSLTKELPSAFFSHAFEKKRKKQRETTEHPPPIFLFEDKIFFMIPSVVNFFKRILEELSPSRLLLSTPYVSFSQDHILGMFSSQESLFLISYLEFEEIYACKRLRSSDSRQASCLDDDSLTVISLFSLYVCHFSQSEQTISLYLCKFVRRWISCSLVSVMASFFVSAPEYFGYAWPRGTRLKEVPKGDSRK